MFIIFGLIFNVNIKENERFLEEGQIKAELADAEKDLKEATGTMDMVNKHMEKIKEKKQQ